MTIILFTPYCTNYGCEHDYEPIYINTNIEITCDDLENIENYLSYKYYQYALDIVDRLGYDGCDFLVTMIAPDNKEFEITENKEIEDIFEKLKSLC